MALKTKALTTRWKSSLRQVIKTTTGTRHSTRTRRRTLWTLKCRCWRTTLRLMRMARSVSASSLAEHQGLDKHLEYLKHRSPRWTDLRPFTVPPFTADNMFDPSAYAADAENWAGWTEFLNEEVFSADSQANAHLVPADMPAAALSPMSEPEATVFLGSDTASERYLTPPPFAADTEASGNLSPSPEAEPTTDASATGDKETVDVDVPLSQLPAWSRALVRAVAGEKVRAKIRMTRGPKWGAQKTAKVKARAGSTSKVGFTLRV
jgi:hypothetical protein